MTNESQVERVKNRLIKEGYITRNQCLKNYISRLSAIILILKRQGWKFKSEVLITNGGKDHIYTLISKPADTLWN